jgi:hypothetical protein
VLSKVYDIICGYGRVKKSTLSSFLVWFWNFTDGKHKIDLLWPYVIESYFLILTSSQSEIQNYQWKLYPQRNVLFCKIIISLINLHLVFSTPVMLMFVCWKHLVYWKVLEQSHHKNWVSKINNYFSIKWNCKFVNFIFS